jgi:hypothetical protein
MFIHFEQRSNLLVNRNGGRPFYDDPNCNPKLLFFFFFFKL